MAPIKSIGFEHLDCTARERENVLIKHTEQGCQSQAAANLLDPGSEADNRSCLHLEMRHSEARDAVSGSGAQTRLVTL